MLPTIVLEFRLYGTSKETHQHEVGKIKGFWCNKKKKFIVQ